MSEAREDKRLGLPTKDQVRTTDELGSALAPWLDTRLNGGGTLAITDIRVPTGSGLANETVMLQASWTGDGTPLSGRFVVRIQAKDPLFPGTSVHQQYQVNQVLTGVPGIPLPTMLELESDTRLLGAPFYVMEHIEGRVPADDPPYNYSGWVAVADTAERSALFASAVETMACLHSVDPGRFAFLNPEGAGDGLRASLDYYIRDFDLALNVPHRVIDAGRRWLLDNYPGGYGLELAWGDARVGNMIFANGQCRAVLDWDMVSLAGPETDLAWWACFEQTYTVCAGIPRLPGIGTPAQLISTWAAVSGRRVRDFDWHLAFAFYKSAVIVRRLATMLKQSGRLPSASESMLYNNPGVQYLASFLGLPSDHPIETPWPGMGNGHE